MSKAKKSSTTRLLLLIGAILLFVKYIIENASSLNLGSGVSGVITFICALIAVVTVIAFFVYFVFFVEGHGAFRTLIPVILLLAIFGQYSMTFGSGTVSSALSSIAKAVWVLMIVSGFVFLFIHKKFFGMTFGISAIVYACFIVVSYIVGLAVDQVSFSVSNLLLMICFAFGLILIFAGVYLGLRRREWID